MNKVIIYVILFSCYALGQVAPYQFPYSIESKEFIDIDIINNTIINFDEFDKESVGKQYVWQKTFNLKSNQRIIVKFNRQECLEKLFLINSNGEFAGPYNIQNIDKTNPFRGSQLTIQISSENDCNINEENFIIEKYQNKLNKADDYDYYYDYRENPVILITGYWPPTNEMIRDFSQSIDLNPMGWIGDNWEGRGYDIVSYFPEFNPPDCDNCGQGYGLLQVDYQNTSNDFWPIVEEHKPIAIITFSRGFIDYSWELEYNYYNRLNWIGDYYPPYLPTPNPPDENVENYFLRNSSLPMVDIMNNINNDDIGLDSYIDWSGDPGHFVSEFMGYHGVWYHDINQSSEDRCITAGHVHVGGLIDIDTAKLATKSTIRTVIDYLDQFVYISGDVNQDEIIDILDLVLIVNYILSIEEFEIIQEYAADINNDGIINIQDIIGIINIILQN